MTNSLAKRLTQSPILLDGGMGQELLHRGVDGENVLWSANALIKAPHVVQTLHEDYLRAGADIITTNTYSTGKRVLEAEGLGDRFVEYNQLAGTLAQQARDAVGGDTLIAGSLPPLGASYRPDLVGPFETLEPMYREQAEILAPYVDLFLCETMSSGEEALAAATAAVTIGKPVWVSLTLRDDGTPIVRSGETIAEAFAKVAHLPIDGLLVNCCAPESVSAAMAQLAELTEGPFGGFANAFTPLPNTWPYETGHSGDFNRRQDLNPEGYADHVGQWLAAGARIVGGCCEVGPAHIAQVRELLDAS